MRFLSVYLILILGLTTGQAFSQKKFNTKGEAQVRIESNMSKEDARNKARELAKVNAIENVLGTFVEQETTIDVSEGETSFKIIGNNKVKGEWIKTKDEDFQEDNRNVKGEFGNETEIWITCKISGTVREIVKARLAFEAVSLNCPQEMCRTTRYYDGEPFYLNFVTPSKGFLSVYVVDTENAYRLLPYQEMSNAYADAIPVKADMKYVFFSQNPDHDYFTDFPPSLVDELIMETDLDKEYMQLYVVFSREPFSKPILNQGKKLEKGSLPKSLSLTRFEEWIQNNRIYNQEFNYEILNLDIVKR